MNTPSQNFPVVGLMLTTVGPHRAMWEIMKEWGGISTFSYLTIFSRLNGCKSGGVG